MAIKMKNSKAPEISDALAVTYREVADLKAYQNNPRKNDSEVPRMVELIKQFGFKVPVLVRGDRIVDGHLRIKAAIMMGLKEVPTIDVGDMPEPAEKALRIALNKSVEWAEWDEDLLGQEMKSIMDAGFELKFTGFDHKETTDLIKKISDAPAIPGDLGTPKHGAKVPKNKDADAGTGADPDYVSITLHMTATNRDLFLKILDEYRTKNELLNHSQAVLSMAKEWGASQ